MAASNYTHRLRLRQEPPKEASGFLELLDPEASEFTFQTFDDWRGEGKNHKLAGIWHGTFQEHASALRRLNERGAGVFVSVNRTDGLGRKKENIVGVRALMLDLDGQPLPDSWPLEPHIIVESSPGRFHCYWRVDNFPLEQYEGVQRALAKRFDGDPDVAKLTACARLPGFQHMKDFENPFRTRIIEEDADDPYTAAEILAAFPPIDRPHRAPISGKLVLSPAEPLKIAEEFVKAFYPLDNAPAGRVFGVRFYRDEFHIWTGNRYLNIEQQRIESEIYQFLDTKVLKPGTKQGGPPTPFNPQMHDVRKVLHALKGGVFLDGKQDAPFWIDGHPPTDTSPQNLIAFQNGLLDIETRELLPHSPALYTVNVLPFAYDPDAPRPKRWYQFLRELWPDDKRARLTLAEIIGYMLTHDARQHKIFMLVGPPRSGKGTIEGVLVKMLGKANVAGVLLRTLGSQFALQPLINKQVAIVSDARLDSHSDLSTITERLLSISGEDTLTVDRKYKDAWTGRLSTRFLILTNEIPRFKDTSGALPKRFIILTMSKHFYGQEDLQLGAKLETELPGILNWALRGEARLRDRGSFVVPKSSQEVIRRLEVLASPVRGFIQDRCLLDPDERIPCKKLFAEWKLWCEEKGLRAGSEHVFGRDLHAAVLEVKTRQGTKGTRFYAGIGLK